jgi:hypothetical protein
VWYWQEILSNSVSPVRIIPPMFIHVLLLLEEQADDNWNVQKAMLF